MVWKSRKFGINNGRTVRASFGRNPAKRSEGLLIQTLCDGEQKEEHSIAYSLGKQNRWLLPEVIKTNYADCAKEPPEEVIVVERYRNEANVKSHRPDCFSVFNSTNGTTRESKRRLARVENLLGDIHSVKTRYDITYPLPSARWRYNGKSTKTHPVQFSTRKKKSFVNWTIEEDSDETNFPETKCEDQEENLDDVNDQTCYLYSRNKDSFLTYFDLASLNKVISQKARKSENKKRLVGKRDTKGCERTKSRKGAVIYVEKDDTSCDGHEQFLAHNQEQERQTGYQRRRGRGRAGRHARASGRSYHRGSYHTAVTPDLPSESAEALKSPREDLWFPLFLNHEEITVSSLAEKWGAKYKEGACFPRAFTLNATPETSQCYNEEVFVICRLFDDCWQQNTSQLNPELRVGTSVICTDGNTHEVVSREFMSWMKVKTADQNICSLDEVVNIAMKCFQSAVIHKPIIKKPSKPRLANDIFSELLGWKSETFPLQMAQQEVKNTFKQKIEQASSESCAALKDWKAVTSNHLQQTECGICFMQFYCKCHFDSHTTCSHTSLNGCGHKFCDYCWKTHLRTQIKLGRIDLKCPGHDCTVKVDDVTLMFLLPSLYQKHVTKRLNALLEINPAWQWCPADQCKLVAKATSPQDALVVGDEHVSNVQPVPVSCDCGTLWCFKCSQDAHWPASCEEARVFREKNQGYAEMVELSRGTSLVTSVQVKNCPFCRYPIEKGLGCHHMVCGLCSQEFCWDCLNIWDSSHICKTKVHQREVELPLSTKHLRTYEHYAVTSRLARSTSVIRRTQKALDLMDKHLQMWGKLPLKVNEGRGANGRTKKHLNLWEENSTSVQHIREMSCFYFQALLALEGLAILLSFTKDSPNKRLVLTFERLFFITERMNGFQQDLKLCYGKERVERLKHLVKCGRECFLIISKQIK